MGTNTGYYYEKTTGKTNHINSNGLLIRTEPLGSMICDVRFYRAFQQTNPFHTINSSDPHSRTTKVACYGILPPILLKNKVMLKVCERLPSSRGTEMAQQRLV